MMRHRPAVAKDEARDTQKKQSISLAAEDHTPSKDRPFRRPSPQLRLRISHLFPVTFLLGVLIGVLWRLGYSPHRNYDNHGKMREAVPHVPGVPGKFSFREKRDEPILSILPLQSSGAWQPSLLTLKASQRLFSELPPGSERTFYAHMSRVCLPIVRALHLIGWQQVDDPKKARLLYTYNRKKEWIHTQESWQRYNHIPGHDAWNRKDTFSRGFNRYREKAGINPYFVPITFDLGIEKEAKQFQKRLFEQGGINQPWVLKIPNVNKGKGVFMLAPNSEELKHVMKRVERDKQDHNYIIQQYICNEMTWQRRKFDVRFFWLVASLDPLIVFYQDGYVRIGNAEYNEADFSNTKNHLTTHTFLGEESKATYDELNQRILDHVNRNPHLKRKIADPVSHVRNQFKESIAMLVDAFKEETFKTGQPLSAEDAYGFFGADCVLDNDLDVWMIEAQAGLGLDEDYMFRLEMHHNLFYGMGMILQEIWDKQVQGLPIFPLRNTGLWEVVYADGWRFETSNYSRWPDKKTCGLAK